MENSATSMGSHTRQIYTSRTNGEPVKLCELERIYLQLDLGENFLVVLSYLFKE